MLQAPFVGKLVSNGFRVPYTNNALAQDLARLHDTWRDFQSSRDRDAVYLFLTDVFELVHWWVVEGQAVERARQSLSLRKIAAPQEIEPLAAVILASVHPKRIDKRTVSKWARALRYVAAYKSPNNGLTRFIKANGGLNACASEYSRRLGRRAKRGWRQVKRDARGRIGSR